MLFLLTNCKTKSLDLNCNFGLYSSDSIYVSNCLSCHSKNNDNFDSLSIFKLNDFGFEKSKFYLESNSTHMGYTNNLDSVEFNTSLFQRFTNII